MYDSMKNAITFIRSITILGLVASLFSCATINFDYPKTVSFSIRDTGDTYFARALSRAVNNRPPEESGFYPLDDGIEALASRLLLARRAERSIDIQYYIIKNDIVGREFMRSLLEAADRGVRIRLQLDDIATSGYDTGLMALESHPNIQIRIFNPFRRGIFGRSLGALSEFSRVNRRLHNKSFTVDNQITIIGGRNIADEYFGTREDVNFKDLDVACIGPIVDEISTMFDHYWNHYKSLPVPAFLPHLENPQTELEGLRKRLQSSHEAALQSEYAAAVRDQVLKFIGSSEKLFQWSPYKLVYDSPDKAVSKIAREVPSITLELAETLQAAEQEVLVISPYFVPRNMGVEKITELHQRGIDVIFITNSLASNNHLVVHSGYAPYRKPLLRNGIRLYETRADNNVPGAELVAATNSIATLHTKAFIVDRRHVFIGSFNFDPRSAEINTEMGVIIDNPAMGEKYAQMISNQLPNLAYEVFLNEDGALRWRTFKQGEEFIYQTEPDTSFWQRFKAGFFRLIPMEDHL